MTWLPPHIRIYCRGLDSSRTCYSLQGGRWSYHQPVNELYVLSKISIQTPGPGHYRSTETVVAGKTTPFGKMNGGRVSTSPLRGHAHDLERVGRAVPGPGYYDTDHLFGMYGRIRAAIPRPQPSRENLIEPEDEFDEYENDSDSSYQGIAASQYGLICSSHVIVHQMHLSNHLPCVEGFECVIVA